LAGGAHDLPARHRTLRSAVAWSVDLLPEAARRLFAQLGTFVGGFSLEAVEAVAITDSPSKTHELLDELLVHSLIRRLDGGGGDGGDGRAGGDGGAGGDEPRFAMLETIREFAAERLAELEEEELIRERHAQWLADLFKRSLAQWRRPDHDAFTHLASDLDNLRAALARPIPADMRLALVANVWLLWEALGLLREGLRWLEEALSQAPAESADRVSALRGAAVLWLDLGDVPRGTAYANESLELARRLGDDWLASRALNVLATTATDLDEAMRNLQECIELQRRSGSPVDTGPLVNLGWIAYGRGDRDGAVAAYRESLRMSEQTGDHGAAAASLTGLAWIAVLDQDPDATTRWASAALEAGERSGEPIWVAEALVQLASADVARGELEAAGERLARAIAELGRGEWEDVRPYVLALTAELALLAGNGHHAARLVASAMVLREHLGGDWPQIAELDQRLLERILASHPDAREAYDEGRLLDSSAAMAHAQEWLASWRQQRQVPHSDRARAG
jgi:tetratricopeptide (TPR) repeat protein